MALDAGEGSEGKQPAEPQSNLDLAETFALLPIRNRLLRNAEPLRELSLAQAQPHPRLADFCRQCRDFIRRSAL